MKKLLPFLIASLLAQGAACATTPVVGNADFYGTDAPMASNAIYFVMTDRFVNGDPSNDQRNQGTFDIPIKGLPAGESANIGYLGGDFKGIVDNARYIRDMGFGAVWITPIVDNPDQPFSGGQPPAWGSILTDRGKTGYHGYWGDNFYKLDEHWPSKGLDYAGFTAKMHAAGLKVVQDIVCNHGSPAFDMTSRQPKFGQLFDAEGKLVADQQNLPPWQLDPRHNPLHAFYHAWPDLAQLSNIDDGNPAVLDYFVDAYLQWIAQGSDAFRIDTLNHMPVAFWRQFAARIRARHPGFFMYGEAFDYNVDDIGQYTLPANGGIDVLDFPLQQAMREVFEHPGSDYAKLADNLFLVNGPYANPYELVTFYDNHDMKRLDAGDAGFIDANNFLFTSRGIPAIYYGSETGFERGRAEHQGNRNYYGQARIDAAGKSPIYRHLKRIAQLRAATPALQRGLMLVLDMHGNRAAFYRVYQHGDTHQIALVLLNKGDQPTDFHIDRMLQPGTWRPAFGGDVAKVSPGGTLDARVAAHDVAVYLLDAAVTQPQLLAALDEAMADKGRPAH
jgi:cyclomaltodextrin glucanotransferase